MASARTATKNGRRKTTATVTVPPSGPGHGAAHAERSRVAAIAAGAAARRRLPAKLTRATKARGCRSRMIRRIIDHALL